ncbi:MAG TPA: PaaI family thioesterase, partial [Rhizomicrobium sp.]|nr:PaaI family thioesterase [Rhizomicrobium sp.]
LKTAREHMNETPYLKAVGGEVLDLGPVARTRLPYGPHLVGDPETGVVHGGVVTALLDHTSGIAVMAKLREVIQIATLDLRIDYMRPAEPDAAIVAECECVRVTHEIAFVRGVAHQGDVSKPIALATAAFMLIRGGATPIPNGKSA